MSEPQKSGGVAGTGSGTTPVPGAMGPQTSPGIPQETTLNNAAPNTDTGGAVQFHSSDIGTQTAVKQDPFREQNKKAAEKAAEKKQNQRKQKKILTIAGVALAGVVILGLVIWLIVALATREPEDGLTNDERKTQQMQTTANELYNNPNNAEEEGVESGEDTTAAKDYFDNIKNEAKDDDERLQALLAEMEFWSVKDQPDLALQAANEIGDFRNLSRDNGIRYCLAYMDAVTALDDPDSVDTSACDQFLTDNEAEDETSEMGEGEDEE